MNINVPLYQFQRGSPFYPLVVNYLVLLFGFKEVGAAGVAMHLQEICEEERENAYAEAKALGNFELVWRLANSNPAELFPSLELVSEQQNETIKINASILRTDLFQNTTHLLPFLKRSAVGSLLIHAYEATQKFHDQGPLWEFLRHCRNAAAHGGRFTLKHGEPKRPAIWGRFTITPSLEGTWLAATNEAQGLLAPGDPLRLLWDLEQANPAMIQGGNTA
jgi:hypothetical protein